MCQRWFLLLIPLFIPAGTSTLDEEAAVVRSSKIEDIIPGDPGNTNTHQLFKRRFTGYKDFNKYKFSKSKGRIPSFFLRNPYGTLLRSKRSNSGILKMLKTLFVNRSEERTEPNQVHLPRGKAIKGTGNSKYDDSKEDNAFNNNVLDRIDQTLTRLDNELKAMEKEKENAFLVFKVPIPFNDYDKKSRTKRETNEPNEDRHDDDSNITVIARTKPNKQETTTKPYAVSKIEEKVEDSSNNTIVLVIARNETDNRNDSASVTETPIDTNKTEAMNNEEIHNKTLTLANKTEAINNGEIDNKTFSLAELRNDTRKSFNPDDDDIFIRKMEEILDDIHIKLSPLKRIKDSHSKDEEYKVGYIIANLESAQETIEKLLNKLKTRESLPRDQAQNILDKVTLSSMVVSNLMNFLGRYSN